MSKALRILIAFVIVCLAGLTAVLLNPDTSAIFTSAQRALVNAKSLHYEVSFEAKGDLASTVLKDAKYGKGIGNIKGSVATDADLSKFPTQSKSTFSIETLGNSGQARKLLGESLKKDGIHYLKLSDASALDERLPDGRQVKSSMIGKWFKTKRPLREWIMPPSERDVVLLPLDTDGFSEFRKALGDANHVTFTKPRSEKEADGTPVWRYHVKLSPDVAVALLLKIRELRSGLGASEDDQIVALLEVQSWGEPEGDVVIGKKDKRIRSVGFSTAMPDGNGGNVMVTARFSAYNLPVQVDAPDAEDLDKETAVADTGLKQPGPRDPTRVTSASSTPLTDPTATSELGGDDDGDGLANSQEYFYGSDPWNPDTDADGYDDGTEVGQAMNPVGPGTLFGFGLGF